MQIEGREEKYQTWTQSHTFGDCRQWEIEGIAWATPGSIVFFIFFQVLIISYPALTDEAAELDAFQTSFPAETTFPTEVQNRSRAGFVQGPQSHTNFIRKEQKVWTGEGSPGSRRGFSQEQKYSYFINFILFPIFILIHQNTLSIILLLPSLTVPNGLKDPFHW